MQQARGWVRAQPVPRVIFIENPGQPLEQQRMPDLQGMTKGSVIRPLKGERLAKIQKGIEAFRVRHFRRPDPLDAQWGLPPPHRFPSIPAGNGQTHLAQVTEVSTSVPNFKGTLVSTGTNSRAEERMRTSEADDGMFDK